MDWWTFLLASRPAEPGHALPVREAPPDPLSVSPFFVFLYSKVSTKSTHRNRVCPVNLIFDKGRGMDGLTETDLD